MPLAIDIQAQAAFKAFVTGTSHTSPLRNWFQEPFAAKSILYGRDIRAIQPDFATTQAQADVYAAANPTVVAKETLREMTLVPGTNSNAYGLYAAPGDPSSTVLGNWVSPFDGSGLGYFPRFYRDAAGTDEITTAFGPTNWFFHAFAGLLIWGGTTPTDNWAAAGVSSVYVTVYRYVGPTLESVVTGGGAPSIVSFGCHTAIPGYGTKFLSVGKVATSAAPWVAPVDMRIVGLSISVDRVDSKDYTVDVLINNVTTFSVPLLAGTTQFVQSVGAALNVGDALSAQVVRISGSGKSTFRNVLVNLQLAST